MSKSTGLGDTIEKITSATGIKKIVFALIGKCNGCRSRRQYLNKRFPYRQMKSDKTVDQHSPVPGVVNQPNPGYESGPEWRKVSE